MSGPKSPEPPVIPFSRLRARLAQPRGARRVDALLAHPDPAAAVAALAVQDLYQLIKDTGLAEADALIALATAEQIRGCLDLDIWDRDRVELLAAEAWLAAVLDAGFEKLGQVWSGLDPELTALLFHRWTKIYDRSLGEEPPEDEERPTFTTPDTYFSLTVIAPEQETVVLVHRLVEDLYRADPVLARHTLMSARSELPAELEESSYRWRSGRLADLGYADFYQALEVFRPLTRTALAAAQPAPDSFAEVEEGEEVRAPGALPVAMAEQLMGKAFLAQAIDRLATAGETERIEAAMLVLVNRVLSALRISPADDARVASGTDYAISTLALGLETFARGDLDVAAAALRTTSLTRLHRLGYTAILRLARLARAMAPRAAIVGEPSRSILEALLAPRPLVAGELDDPPTPEPRPFASAADVRRAARALSELTLRLAIAQALGVDLAALLQLPEPRPELDDYVRSALVRALSGGPFDAAPLAADEILAFRRAAFAEARLRDDARERAAAALARCLDDAQITSGRDLLPGLLTTWFEELRSEFAGLSPLVPPDPRFVGHVIVAMHRS